MSQIKVFLIRVSRFAPNGNGFEQCFYEILNHANLFTENTADLVKKDFCQIVNL